MLEPELGYSEPPVAELALTPKCEYTLCRQLGCDRSELASNVGADWSLVLSPLNTNVWPIAPDVVELELAEVELEFEGRKSVQGTATCLPELEGLELSEALDVDDADAVALELDRPSCSTTGWQNPLSRTLG